MGYKKSFTLITLFFTAARCLATDIFIYNTTLNKPASVEKELSEIIQGAQIRVFARYIDFKTMIDKSKPAIVIAPPLTLKSLNLDKNIKVRGVLKENTSQPYLLVSLDSQIDLAAKPDAKIGALDIAGRKEMKDLISQVVGPKAKYKSVTKLEDLIPMLTFKSADAILITPLDLELLKSRTKANLYIKTLDDKKFDNSSIALNPNSSEPNQAESTLVKITKLGQKDLKVLGVQSWK